MTIKEIAADPDRPTLFASQRFASSRERADLAQRFVRATISIYAEDRFQKSIHAAAIAAGRMIRATPSTPGEFLTSVGFHPSVKRAFLGARLADVAIVGISSSTDHVFALGIVDALLDEFVTGMRWHYASLAGLATAFGVKVPRDSTLLPDGPLDFEKIGVEMLEAQEGQKRLWDEAKRSGLPAYPPLRPEDDDAGAQNS